MRAFRIDRCIEGRYRIVGDRSPTSIIQGERVVPLGPDKRTGTMALRIGIDISTLRPPFTGIANYEIQLVQRLLATMPQASFVGFGVYRWCNVDAEFLTSRFAQEIPATRQKSSPLRYSTLAHTIRNQMRRAMFSATVNRQSLDLYHAFSYRPPADPAAPIIPVVYDLSTVRHPETHPPARLKFLEPLQRLCEKAPAVHTISRFTAQEITDLFHVPPERIVIAPPGVNPLFLEPRAPERAVLAKLALSPGSYVLSVATLEPRKNLKTLIAAFSQLSTAVRLAMPLVVVGARGWGDIALPKMLERLEVEGSVRFAGYVTDEELRSLYAGARAMLYPSLYEGFGMPITEALACGTQVIASASSSMPEAGGPQTRFVTPLDVDRWRSELEHVAGSNSYLDVPGRLARTAYARSFSWDQSAETVRKMYERVLA